MSQSAHPQWNQIGVKSVIERDELADLNKRFDLPGLLFFAGHLVGMIAAGWIYHLSLGTAWVIPACLLFGTTIVYWFQPFHECAHGTAFKTRLLNKVVVWFSGILIHLEPTYFYYEHMEHHRFTQHPQRDPERIPLADKPIGYLLYLTALPYFYYVIRNLITHASSHFTDSEKRFIPTSKQSIVTKEARILCCLYCVLIISSIVLHSWWLMIYWIIPRLVGEPVQRMVRLTEHQGCPLTPDLFSNTRTVMALLPIQLLGWYSCYHGEHHISPNTPFHRMPTLHQRLRSHMQRMSCGYRQAHTQIMHHVWQS